MRLPGARDAPCDTVSRVMASPTSPSMPRFRTAHVVLGALLAMVGAFFAVLFASDRIPALRDAPLPASVLAGVLAALWARAQRVSFGDDAVTLQRPWGDRVIPYAEITDAELSFSEPLAAPAPGAAPVGTPPKRTLRWA